LTLGAAACGSDDSAADTTTAPTTSAPTTSAAAATTEPATSAAATDAPTTDAPATDAPATDAPGTEAPSTDAPSTQAPTTEADEFDLATYCSAETAFEEAKAGLGDPDEDPVAFGNAALAAAAPAHDAAPEELRSSFDTVVSLLQSVIDTKSSAPLEAPLPADIHTYDAANCDWTGVPVTLKDYEYVGLPDTLTAGTYTFEATSEGTEPHLLIIVKKRDGVTDSFDDLLAAPEEEANAKTEMVAAVFVPPGGNDHAVATLTPGDYLALCPITQHSSMASEAPGDGPPHFVLGMRHEIVVE
jgi:hypothetical protein